MTAWNPVCSYWRSLSLPTVFTLYCFLLRIGGCGPWVLLLSRLDGLLEFFCFPWRCPVLFRLGSLVSLCHVRLVNMVGRCWLVRWCELVSDFSLSDCNFCSAHGGLHADTQVAVVGSFSFACHATTRFWNKATETKTSKTPIFPKLKFCCCDFGMLLMWCRSR